MVPNPFIELYRDPVAALAWLGYFLALATLLVATAGICWQNAVTVYVQYDNNWHRWNYLPPLTWLARVAAIPAVLAVDAWAAAALLWLLT